MKHAKLLVLVIAASASGMTARARPPVPHRPRTTAAIPVAPPLPPLAPPQLHGIQYLYGSAEAAALTRQTWRALVAHVADALAHPTHQSVILARGSSLARPSFTPCDDKPPAVVLDVDETSILNLGFEYDDLKAQRPIFDDDVWSRWEQTGAAKVVPTPGAKDAVDRLRKMGVAIIFNTNRNAFNASHTEEALNKAGLGPAKHGDTLYLAGDDPGGSMKDGRRAIIAGRYCVLAMAGDQLVDFSDHFDFDPAIISVGERRAAAETGGIAEMWGNGWFVMPNPAYGSALQGGADDIFPNDTQWRDPGPAGVDTEKH